MTMCNQDYDILIGKKMILNISKVSPTAIIPTYASAGAACFDLHADMSGDPNAFHCVNHGTPALIRTGLAVEVPENHVMLVFSRSGHGFKTNVRLSNCTGVIDSDYRGEIMVRLTRDNDEGGVVTIRHGDRIAQAMIVPIPRVIFYEVDESELTRTERGTSGFGSTGDNGIVHHGV